MASSSALFSSLSTNYARIGNVAQQLFPDILKELITIKEPPQRLSHDVTNNKYLSSNLRPDERFLINNVTTKGYADFDIPLIYKLIRNLNLLPSPPTNGWDSLSAPSVGQIKPGDDIERVRRFRNEICHRGNAEITDTDLSQNFTQFKAIASRLETYLGKQPGEFVNKFINLETCCMDEETRNVYITRFEECMKNVQMIQAKVEDLELSQDAVITQTNLDVQMIQAKIEEIERLQGEVIPPHIREGKLLSYGVFDSLQSKLDKTSRGNDEQFGKLYVAFYHGYGGDAPTSTYSFLGDNSYNEEYTLKQEQFEIRLKQWKKDDEMFVTTEAEKKLLTQILEESCVTIIGNSGTGKSYLSRHVALSMMEQGYMIIPCYHPEDIRRWFKHGKKTIFVFDDVCGRYTLNKIVYNDWYQRHEHIESLLEDKSCKIMSTCRLQVYKDKKFHSLSIFKRCSIDLSSKEFRLTAAERFALTEKYLMEHADYVVKLSEKYDFFPLLCKLYHKQEFKQHLSLIYFFSNPFDVLVDEVRKLYLESKKGKRKYCSLVLCVLFNNTLTDETLTINDKENGVLIEDLLEKCGLNKGTSVTCLMESLKTLDGSFVVQEENTYKIIHDKLFDCLSKYFGEKMLQLFIKHAKSGFIRERFFLKTADNIDADIEYAIPIPDDKIQIYIERLVEDWKNGYVDDVFMNRNMNHTTFSGKFINHISKNDISYLQKLASINDINSKNRALAGSCFVGSVELVKWLIRMKSDINYCGEDGNFALFWASQEGHAIVVKEMIQHSADTNQCKNDGVSSLWIASQNGHVGAVKELLQHGARVNKCDQNNVSPLWKASQNGKVEVVKELLKYAVEINEGNFTGVSPLLIASENGHVDVVIELLTHLADVNKRMYDGVSPLWMASQNGHVPVVKELLQHGANVNECNYKDVSPLWKASQNGQVAVVKELVKNDVKINAGNDTGVTPLLIASENGHVEVVLELLNNSADVNKCMCDGSSPLWIASQNGHVSVVKELLQHGARVNKCNQTDVSPLWKASQNGQVEVVKELLKYAVEINAGNVSGVSSLFIASENGHIDVVKELLKHSADFNKCRFDGVSPLRIASQNNHDDVVAELLRQNQP